MSRLFEGQVSVAYHDKERENSGGVVMVGDWARVSIPILRKMKWEYAPDQVEIAPQRFGRAVIPCRLAF